MSTPSARMLRLSPLHHKQLALGASMREYEGTLRPENYGAPAEVEAEKALRSVGVCDISPVGKMDVKGRSIDDFLGSVLASNGAPRDPGEVYPLLGAWNGAAYACRLTREHALIVGQPERPDTASLAASRRCYLTDLTSALAGLNVVGPSSVELLMEMTQLDLSSRQGGQWCSEGGLAKVRSIVVRVGAGSFDLFFGRDCAEYVWDELMHLGKRYSLSPFGVEAYRLIQNRKEATR